MLKQWCLFMNKHAGVPAQASKIFWLLYKNTKAKFHAPHKTTLAAFHFFGTLAVSEKQNSTKLVSKGLQTTSLTRKHGKNYAKVGVLSAKNSSGLLAEHDLNLSLLQLYPPWEKMSMALEKH